MFCINCGKQIVDTARFCNYCGAKVVNFDENPVQNPVENPENPLSVPVEDVKNPENVENSVDLLKMQNDDSSSAAQMNEPEESDTRFSEKETEEIAGINETAGITGITGTSEALSPEIQSGAVGAQHNEDVSPAPEQLDMNIPISAATEQPSISVTPEQSPISTTPEQPIQSEQPVHPERRYTLGHIIMCLASTALMAIVAGVFAGLYFSVV